MDASVSILTADGHRLGATVYEPEGAAIGTVVINGGTAIAATFYRHFASYLAAGGMRVVTFDYRGIGASRPPDLRGLRATMSDWGALDAPAVWRFAQASLPGPVALVAHSFGAQLLGMSRAYVGGTAATVVVAGQTGYYGHWPLLQRLRLGLLWRAAVPALTRLYGYLPGAAGLGHDLPSGVARQWARWCSHPDYLAVDYPAAAEHFAALDCPTLYYSFTDDEYAPQPAVEQLLGLWSQERLTHHRFAPAELGAERIGHFGFFREAHTLALWRQTRSFLRAGLRGVDTLPLRPAANGRDNSDAVVNRIQWSDIMADLEYGQR